MQDSYVCIRMKRERRRGASLWEAPLRRFVFLVKAGKRYQEGRIWKK